MKKKYVNWCASGLFDRVGGKKCFFIWWSALQERGSVGNEKHTIKFGHPYEHSWILNSSPAELIFSPLLPSTELIFWIMQICSVWYLLWRYFMYMSLIILNEYMKNVQSFSCLLSFRGFGIFFHCHQTSWNKENIEKNVFYSPFLDFARVSMSVLR